MRSEWKKVKLGDVCKTISKTGKFFADDEVVFINTGDIHEGKFLHSNKSIVKSLPGQAKKVFMLGDILYSEIRPVNKHYALVRHDTSNYLASTKLMVIRHNEQIVPMFLYLFLTSESTIAEFQMLAATRSGTFPQITFETISNTEISLPPLPVQQSIAQILSSLDDKIELLREQNKTLETLAKTLFKRWFVDFEFPNEDGKPYKSSGGKMVESELGLIPEGWRVGKLEEVVGISTGKGISQEEIVSGQYKVIGANGVIGSTNKYLKDTPLILTGRVGTLGVVSISRGKVWISDNVLICEPVNDYYLYYVYFKMERINFQSLNRGSTQPLLTQTDLKNIATILPPVQLMSIWDDAIKDLMTKAYINESEIGTLIFSRNTLLPKLMAGEFEI